MRQWIKKACGGLLDWVYPRDCIGCGAPMGQESLRYLCQNCVGDIRWVQSPHCASCGFPFYGAIEGERVCPHCIELEPLFQKGWTAFLLKGVGRSLIHELKYHQGYYLKKDLQNLLQDQEDFVTFVKDSILVPVPLHPRKLK